MFWHLRKYIKEIHRKTFSGSIPVKIVLKRPGWAPASYLTDTKDRTEKPNREWYEIAIIAKKGDDLARACHEVRHRWQRNNPGVSLFTREKLIQMLDTKSIDTRRRIKNVLVYLDKLWDQIKNDPLEIDAIVVERLAIETPHSNKVAPIWVRQDANRVF